VTTDEENISSVSHTTTTTGEPVYWKSRLLQAVSQKQLSDLVRNAIKEAKGNACPFCSSALGSKSTRNRHMKDSCQVLQSNQSRIRATRGIVTDSPCPMPSSEIQHQKHHSVIVQSSRYEAPQTQALPKGNQDVRSSEDLAPKIQVQKEAPPHLKMWHPRSRCRKLLSRLRHQGS
jgi:hypothetical protein